ncbi:MAG: SRPBCC family protein [Sphingopyxis sp.]
MTSLTEHPFDLSVTRHIAAPPDAVWHAMTQQMALWWCPRPWQTEIIEQDKRPGGRCAMVMRGPNGEESAIEGVYLDYQPGVRFVFTDAFRADFAPHDPPFMVGIFAIATEGDGTRYTATARHWTQAARDQHHDMGFTDGWTQCMDQLAELFPPTAA